MCVIIWSPTGKIPKNHILRAMQAHPHGWGFSVATGRGIPTYKTTDRDRFIDAWETRIRGPVLFHARWATHGHVCKENCHPFTVKGHGLVAAHNGVIGGFGSALKSDTRDFLEQMVEPMPKWFLEERVLVNTLENFIGNSKMVFLNREGNVTILNEEMGIWKHGMWYSNGTVL